jgi:thiamine-phosphate pyrophosphorylase
LYLVCDEPSDVFLDAALGAGVQIVQLRMKGASDEPILAAAARVARACAIHGALFILNDRPDLAVRAGADGVHVGQDDAPPALARRILGPHALVGFSTHGPDELDAAADEPVDYLSAGPVEPTPTKPGRPGTGPGYLAYAAAKAAVPWFVTGGVTPDTIPAMVAAGARRFVVVRWLTRSDDPAAAARQLRHAIEREVGEQR